MNRTGRRVTSAIAGFLLLTALAVMSIPVAAGATVKHAATAVAPNLKDAKGTNSLWHRVGKSGAQPNALTANPAVAIHATHVGMYTLNNAGMRAVLARAPREFTKAAIANPLVISLPAPDGSFQRFSVVYSPVMMPRLAKKHPEIRTYSGKGIDDPTASIRFSMTPLGFDAMTRGTGTWLVDPYYHLKTSVYGSYYEHNVIDSEGGFEGESQVHGADQQAAAQKAEKAAAGATPNAGVSVGSVLKIYRLAMITDPAYAQDVGFDPNVPSTAQYVTDSKVALVNRIDLAYETDLGYRMDLVAGNDQLNLNTYAQAIGRNGPCGNAACYTLSNLTSCSTGTHQTVIGKIIGAANYDIGHLVLGASGGGVAGLGVVGGGSKASGCTGLTEVGGDYLAFDYTGHEMGHEFGMDHTFNGNDAVNCNSNRTNSSAVEPGSGSTIMAYAGICTNDDTQAHNDPYFSFRSFDQSEAYTSSNLNPLAEVQAGSFYHLGGGNEVQQVTFGGNPGDLRVDKPGVAYATVKEIHPGVRVINASPAGASEIGHTVTIQTTSKHEYELGETVTINVTGDPRYNCTSCAITALPVHGDTGSRTIQYTLPGFADLPNSGGGTITPDTFGATESGNTVTITTKTAHLLNVGDNVTIAGISATGYNGTYTVSATPTANTFQYNDPTAGLAPSGAAATSTATATTNSPFQIGLGGNDSPVIGGSGLAYNTTNVQNAINNLLGCVSCAVVSGLNAGGWTTTYSGAPVAGVDVPSFTLDNLQCHGCYNQVAETNHGGAFDSFTLNYNGTDSAVITNGSNYTTAGITAALQGVSEVQTVALSNYTVNGNSYTLTYNGNDSVPIVRGQNNTAAGIQAAIQGGNEQQAVTFANFNATNAGNSYQVQIGGNLSAVLGNGGTAISNNSVAAAINAIAGFSGTVTVSGASNTAGPTITFGGASANTDVPAVSIVFGACSGAGTPCTATNRENVKGSSGFPGWVSGTTVSIGTVTDTGYTVTFNGLGNVNSLSVTNGTGSPATTGTVTETTPGTNGILPPGASATVAGVANTGFTVTFGGTLGAANAGNIGLLTITNPTPGLSGFFAETTKGGPAPYNKGYIQQPTGNTPPTVTAPPSHTIPYQTPFTLTGSATDPDAGQTLTYLWEQTNTGTGTSLVSNTKPNGPLFRVFGTALDENVYQENTPFTGYCVNGENCTTTDPSRTFPDMQQILINNTNAETGTCPQAGPVLLPQPIVDCYSEFLPTSVYAGPMNFRLTVRDGNLGAGGVGSADTSVSLAPGTGPFLVTSPNTPVTWQAGSTQAVTWNVAGTDAAPISTATVKILLSTDGGNTFPTVLAASVPNNGSANVTLPNTATANARIEVAPADGNIYFDVSDTNFTISKADQTITFAPLANKTYNDPNFAISATASSGLPVNFTSSTPSVCTIVAGPKVHIMAGGTCTIVAHQPGDANFNAAPDVTRSFTVDPHATTTKLTIKPKKVTSGGSVTFTATVNGGGAPPAGLTVQFKADGTTVLGSAVTNSSGVAKLTINIALPVGPHTIRAITAANANFSTSTSAAVTLKVKP